MKRREFITVVGGAAAWPILVVNGQADQTRRLGVMLNLAPDDPETKVRLTAFFQGLQELGWTEGRNLKIDYRWGMGNLEHHRTNASELVALAPDVILVHGSTIMGPLRQATRTVPIVFVSVSDPIAGGFVESLAHPGGNATGFTSTDYGMSGKWLELLKQVAPTITRVGVIRDPDQVSGGGQLGAIQAVASLLGVEFNPLGVHDANEIKRTITTFAQQPNGGLIVTTSALAQIHRDLIIALAAQYQLPTIYPYRLFVSSGGLICYGPQIVDEYRRAASYVDRIFKGEKPSDLPVQQPEKFDLVINLKTAKALGIEVPPTLLARAAEVIE
jgi:ABC-type uncharacterized transport system substrate-binding protein